MRDCECRARARITASDKDGPSGFEESSGTVSSPHWKPSRHALHAITGVDALIAPTAAGALADTNVSSVAATTSTDAGAARPRRPRNRVTASRRRRRARWNVILRSGSRP